ncbi:MAG TPA: hypothetical protein VM736_14785, partial [Gemmatimonadales bacterium]|nr:hypothetical protein [Gemmatimonadales bacterium]
MTRHDATRSVVRGPSGPGAISGSVGLRVALLVGLAACRESSAGTPFSPSPGGPTPAPSVHVQGNALV